METEIEKARQWRAKAEEVQCVADVMRSHAARRTLYEVAHAYLKMADAEEIRVALERELQAPLRRFVEGYEPG